MGPVIFGITARDIDELAGASCAETEPELFYPAGNELIQFEEAATVCFSCPVKVACLAGARARGESFGVWGGVNFEKSPAAAPFDPTKVAQCGTYAGAKRHRKRDQDVCDPCKAAAVAYDRKVRELRNSRITDLEASA